MDYATNFAVVENGVVTNVIWGMVSNREEFVNAIQIDDLCVNIGDTYVDGKFYHEGTEVLTTEQQLLYANACNMEVT